MTTSGFARALPRVLAHEGGYVDDPFDPGGATNKGITFRVYDAYRTRNGLPTRDVRAISATEVAEIYRLQYWDAVKGDELPPGLDYVLFDGAVNSGPSQSIKWLQRALGDVAVDGQIGQATLAAVMAHGRPGGADRPDLRSQACLPAGAEDMAAVRQGLARACRRRAPMRKVVGARRSAVCRSMRRQSRRARRRCRTQGACPARAQPMPPPAAAW